MKFFSDEKNFTVDCAFNRRNDRRIASSRSEIQSKMTTKQPAKVMTLCVVSSEGDVLTHFFEPTKKVNSTTYCEVLTKKVIPWMKDKSNGKSFIFQQDSVTAHTDKKTIQLLQKAKIKFWPKDDWPSNSPDLNPLDYYFWGRIVGKACLKPHNSIIILKRSIKRAIDTVDKAEIIHAVSRFRSRVEAVVANEGGHIEG